MTSTAKSSLSNVRHTGRRNEVAWEAGHPKWGGIANIAKESAIRRFRVGVWHIVIRKTGSDLPKVQQAHHKKCGSSTGGDRQMEDTSIMSTDESTPIPWGRSVTIAQVLQNVPHVEPETRARFSAGLNLN